MEKVKVWTEKFIEAFTACCLAMVQGDLTVLSLKHAMMAGQVGALTGFAFVIALSLRFESKFLAIALTGLFTGVADYLIHPPMFQYEAVVTGICAAFIALIFEIIFRRGLKNEQ